MKMITMPRRNGLRIHEPGERPPSGPGCTTVRDVVEWFVPRRKGTSEVATIEIRRVLHLFSQAFGDRQLDEMTGADLIDFVEGQSGLRSLHSIARWYRTIKQPFNLAERLGKIGRNPFRAVEIPRGERGRDMTPGEFRALLRNANPLFRRVLIFLRYSGARPCELRRLTWSMIEWTKRGATIVQHIHKTSATQATPKPRKIVLPPQLVRLLLWMKQRSWTDHVFVNLRGTPWEIGSLCCHLRRLRATAGLGHDVKLYGCRHAFATRAILNGIDIATLAQLMGHVRTATTEIYLHLADKGEHLQAAVSQAVVSIHRS